MDFLNGSHYFTSCQLKAMDDMQQAWIEQIAALTAERDQLRAELAEALRCSGENAKAWLDSVTDEAIKRTHLLKEIGIGEQEIAQLRADLAEIGRIINPAESFDRSKILGWACDLVEIQQQAQVDLAAANERAAQWEKQFCEVIEACKEALRGALRLDPVCLHEDTHRGGAIWTICEWCGKQWADDEGGFKPDQPNKEIERVLDALSVIAAWEAARND